MRKRTSIDYVYKLVWNVMRGAWTFVPEITSGNAGTSRRLKFKNVFKKSFFTRLKIKFRSASITSLGAFSTVLSLDVCALDSNSLPNSANVSHGNAQIDKQGNTLIITQSSDRAVINWQSFNVGEAATVKFDQPTATAATLNRITNGVASKIAGTVKANGNVFILNPAGIVFNKTAQVNVGGLIASTMALSDDDFLKGKNSFSLNGSDEKIVNKGTINAKEIVFLGAHVDNAGTLTDNTGVVTVDNDEISLLAGEKISFGFGATGYLQLEVNPVDIDVSVNNSGAIGANGGTVKLVAFSGNELVSAVVSSVGAGVAYTTNTVATTDELPDPAVSPLDGVFKSNQQFWKQATCPSNINDKTLYITNGRKLNSEDNASIALEYFSIAKNKIVDSYNWISDFAPNFDQTKNILIAASTGIAAGGITSYIIEKNVKRTLVGAFVGGVTNVVIDGVFGETNKGVISNTAQGASSGTVVGTAIASTYGAKVLISNDNIKKSSLAITGAGVGGLSGMAIGAVIDTTKVVANNMPGYQTIKNYLPYAETVKHTATDSAPTAADRPSATAK